MAFTEAAPAPAMPEMPADGYEPPAMEPPAAYQDPFQGVPMKDPVSAPLIPEMNALREWEERNSAFGHRDVYLMRETNTSRKALCLTTFWSLTS